MATVAPPPTRSATSASDQILFIASILTLIAAGIGFSVRGAILKDWGQQYGFTQTELGTITGGGLAGFGLAIIFFSFFADLFGYGKLMLVAFLLHLSSAVVTFAATYVFDAYGKEYAFYCLSAGMWLFALGNGTCEAVINPLTATLFPNNKTHYLNMLHAGWPIGLVLGAAFVYAFNQTGAPIRWEVKLGVFLVPVVLYGLLMFNRAFPRSEASASGITFGASVLTLLSPILLFLFVLHALVGYVELGTDSWITNITAQVLANGDRALLAFIWTNVLMAVLRFFAGPIVHKINPVGLLAVSAVFGTLGLYLMGGSFTSGSDVAPWMIAVTIYALGKTFYWPTLLGVISENFPRGGALALGISGGIGMLSAGLLGGPGIGYKQDYFAVQKLSELGPDTYARYQAKDEAGNPVRDGFPVLSKVAPDKIPPVAGLAGDKLKVFDDKAAGLAADLATIAANDKAGKPVGEKLRASLTGLETWWKGQGEPNYAADKDKLETARLYGAKQALLYTALVPAALVVGFLLLYAYFAARGGYKQVHLDGPGGVGHAPLATPSTAGRYDTPTGRPDVSRLPQ